jgi:uncharacterized cupin superfamily protein
MIFNLAELELGPTREEGPAGHRFTLRSPGAERGAKLTGITVYDLDPGQATWPYHFELIEEEWLLVVAGEVVLRTPDGERGLRAGDVACFPAGPAGGHAVRNDGEHPARFAMPSSRAPYGDGAVYPDSGKFVVRSGDFSHRGRFGEHVEYWEGEGE